VKITEGRREEIEAVLQGYAASGGRAYMATLTIPHHSFQSCASLRRAVSSAYRGVKSGRAWGIAREGYGWLGDIRALEVTHGENGWHPHLHVLVLFKPGISKDKVQSFSGWLFQAWAAAVERLGMGRCSGAAFSFEPVSVEHGAAEYVGKWGAALELSKAHVKKGRHGRTPWQILADFAETGGRSDGALFKEYAAAFKGARQLTWSRALRALYVQQPEPSDGELAAEKSAPETHAATLTRELFKAVVARGKTAEILLAQENAGVDGVLAVLSHVGIPWRLSKAPGLERGRMVPLISLGQPGEHSRGCPRDVPLPANSTS
jgi:hypothetical protein